MTITLQGDSYWTKPKYLAIAQWWCHWLPSRYSPTPGHFKSIAAVSQSPRSR